MADLKLTALTALASVAVDDILYVVDDPGGTPLSRKATVTNVLSAGTVAALSAGRAGGQTLIGGTAASETLTLQSTAHATRGNIIIYDDIQTAASITNTLLGVSAGASVTGTQVSIFGYNSDAAADVDKALVLGDGLTAAADNDLLIGSNGVTLIAGNTGATPTFAVFGATPQARQAHIVDADGTLADVTAKFNTLKAAVEGFGFFLAA